MKVLITGASGFVGLPLTRLAASRCEVVALVSPRANTVHLDEIAPKVTLVRGDLTDDGTIETLVQTKPEVCIHAAWYTNASDYLDSPRNVDSLSATLRVALRLGAAGCQRFVGVGTCLEYDTSGAVPLTESSPLEPGRLYSACKVGAWHALRQVGRLTNMAVAWARLFYLYGPREDSRRFVRPWSARCSRVVRRTSARGAGARLSARRGRGGCALGCGLKLGTGRRQRRFG